MKNIKPKPGYANSNQMLWIKEKAMSVCKGVGIDIGCENMFNKLPGALSVDINNWSGVDFVGYAEDFPRIFKDRKFDYVFSSHCLEHILDWKGALRLWKYVLIKDGILFLYLPNPLVAPEWSRRRLSTHKHDFTLHMVLEELIVQGDIEIVESAYDEYASFYIVGVKR